MLRLTATVIALSLGLAGCGKNDDDESKDDLVEKVLADEESKQDFVSDIVREVMDQSTAGESSADRASGQGLMADPGGIQSSTQSCKTNGDTAVVDVVADVNSTATNKGTFFTSSITVTGKGTQKRNWALPGATVSCTADNKYAKIDFNNPTNLKLDMDIDHTLKFVFQLTNNKNQKTYTQTNDKKMTGKRSATINSISKSGVELTVNKTLTSDVTHNDTVTKANGTQTTRVYSVATTTPVQVSTVRDTSKNFALLRQTVSTGALEAKGQGGGKAAVAVTSLQFDHTSTSCALQSGTIAFVFESKDGSKKATISCVVSGTELSCTEDSGKFEVSAPLCDKVNQT